MFDNIQIPFGDSGLIYFDIIIGKEKYQWATHVTDGSIGEFLTAHESEYLLDLNTKLAAWDKMPHTKEVTDEFGNKTTVEIPIGDVVFPKLTPPPSAIERIANLEGKQALLVKAVDTTKLTTKELTNLQTSITAEAIEVMP